jgi:hypothetical protein
MALGAVPVPVLVMAGAVPNGTSTALRHYCTRIALTEASLHRTAGSAVLCLLGPLLLLR